MARANHRRAFNSPTPARFWLWVGLIRLLQQQGPPKTKNGYQRERRVWRRRLEGWWWAERLEVKVESEADLDFQSWSEQVEAAATNSNRFLSRGWRERQRASQVGRLFQPERLGETSLPTVLGGGEVGAGSGGQGRERSGP